MPKKAILFPGQGAQYVGMGKDFFEEHSVAKEIFSEANEILGYDLLKVCFEGPEADLTQTVNSQPAIYVTSWAIYNVLLEKGKIEVGVETCFAGLSLGEFTAHTACGTWSYADGLRLVQKRAQLMQGAAESTNGTMASVLNLDVDVIDKICGNVDGIVQSANYNNRSQIVISGERAAVEAASSALMDAGARRVIPLSVSGAFHSPLMQSAEAGLREAVNSVSICETSNKVYSNVTARAVEKNAIADTLVKQLTSPVLWYPTMENLIEESCMDFVEVGPGKVLTGLMKRINKDANIINFDKVVDLNQ